MGGSNDPLVTAGRKNRIAGKGGGREGGGERRHRNEEMSSCLGKGAATRLARVGVQWPRADPGPLLPFKVNFS